MKKGRMDESSRHYIAVSLTERKNISEIAAELGKSVSTISREVKAHFTVRRTGGFGKPFNECRTAAISATGSAGNSRLRNANGSGNRLMCATAVPAVLPVRWKSIITKQSAPRKSMNPSGQSHTEESHCPKKKSRGLIRSFLP